MGQTVTPKVECVDTSENYGRFEIQPLEPGFGITLGNSLRRVLLSSLPGAAVTAVKIEGVQHEFSMIPHLKEDIIEFVLNVKEIRLRPLSDRPERLYLEMQGEGAICAGDINPSSDFEIINPELHLATLDSADAKLDVVFYVEHGKGYLPSGHGDGLPIGVIPVDAIFSPVRKVNYTVEKTHFGQVSNYDRLVLEVWTDGTLTPSEAVSKSAEIITGYFTIFRDLGKVVKEEEEVSLLPIPSEQYEMPLEQLDLSARTFNALRRSGINKVGELLERSREELLGLRSFGQKSFEEVWSRLEKMNLLPTTEEASEATSDDKKEYGDEELYSSETKDEEETYR